MYLVRRKKKEELFEGVSFWWARPKGKVSKSKSEMVPLIRFFHFISSNHSASLEMSHFLKLFGHSENFTTTSKSTSTRGNWHTIFLVILSIFFNGTCCINNFAIVKEEEEKVERVWLCLLQYWKLRIAAVKIASEVVELARSMNWLATANTIVSVHYTIL